MRSRHLFPVHVGTWYAASAPREEVRTDYFPGWRRPAGNVKSAFSGLDDNQVFDQAPLPDDGGRAATLPAP